MSKLLQGPLDLIENLLDFARGRLAGGVPVILQAEEDLAGALDQAVTELRMSCPHRQILTAWRACVW